MVEFVFVAVTAVSLFFLFRGVSFKHAPFRAWQCLAGVILLALPGCISLVFMVTPFFSRDPFGAGETVLVPVVPERDLYQARAFLVRGFHVVEGNEAHPIDTLQAVLVAGKDECFDLQGNSRLCLSINRKPGNDPDRDPVATLDFYWKASTGTRSGSIVVTPVEGNVLNASHEVWLAELPMDFSPLGSLLKDENRLSRIHFLITPLADRAAVKSLPAAGWWKENSRTVVMQIREGMDRRQRVNESSSSSTFSSEVPVSAVLLCFSGSVLFLIGSLHWVRTGAFLLLYVILYVGALDSFALRIHRAGLHIGEAESRLAAVVETAGTRMHPVSAAESLLGVALEDQDPEVCLCALRCLGRSRLIKALIGIDGAVEKVEGLTFSDDAAISNAARRIVKMFPSVGG